MLLPEKSRRKEVIQNLKQTKEKRANEGNTNEQETLEDVKEKLEGARKK